MFAPLYMYFLQNWSVVPTLCDYAMFLLIMQLDAARGQLCEIAPAHNIRIPVKMMVVMVVVVLYDDGNENDHSSWDGGVDGI